MPKVCEIALRDDQVVKLVKLRVGIYCDPRTLEARISLGYWQRADDAMKLGITAMIAPYLLSEVIEEVEAKRALEVASE